MHNFFIVFKLEFLSICWWYIFITSHIKKFSTENGFIKTKCFFTITIKGHIGIYFCHCLSLQHKGP